MWLLSDVCERKNSNTVGVEIVSVFCKKVPPFYTSFCRFRRPGRYATSARPARPAAAAAPAPPSREAARGWAWGIPRLAWAEPGRGRTSSGKTCKTSGSFGCRCVFFCCVTPPRPATVGRTEYVYDVCVHPRCSHILNFYAASINVQDQRYRVTTQTSRELRSTCVSVLSGTAVVGRIGGGPY